MIEEFMGGRYLDEYNRLKRKFHSIFIKISNNNGNNIIDVSKKYTTIVDEVIEFAEGLKIDEATNQLWIVKEWFLTEIINLGDNTEIGKRIKDKIKLNGIDIINVKGIEPPTDQEIIDIETKEAIEALEKLSKYFNFSSNDLTVEDLPPGNLPNTLVDINHPDIKYVYRFLIEYDQINYVPFKIFKEILLGKSKYKLTYKGMTAMKLLIILHALKEMNILSLNVAFYERIFIHKGNKISFSKTKPDLTRVVKKIVTIRGILDTYRNKKQDQ